MSDARQAGRASHLRAVPGGLAELPEPLATLLGVGEEVRHAWLELLQETFDAAEVSQAIDWVVESLSAPVEVTDLPDPVGSLTLNRFLLERFHSGLLTALEQRERISRTDALALLRRVDAVRQRIEPEWDRYFASQISGPDGLNMVTEVLHDLRSPLTSIRCLAEMLERGQSGPVTDIQRQQLRLIYSASLGIGSMATDVIEMARHGDQVPDGERVPFSVSEVLEGVATLVRPIAEEKGLAMQFGELATDQRIGLPHALSRVLLNLVTNALKFTDQGGVEVRIRPTAPSRVEFSVVDSGRGIPESAIPQLFRPFRRAPAPRAGRSGYLFSGTGLGLALCRKLLRSMDSDLLFDTEPGKGTRFFFELELPPPSHL